ncbi:MAG: DUF1080 domain-containing protein, partial [Planctomycetales bacterium]
IGEHKISADEPLAEEPPTMAPDAPEDPLLKTLGVEQPPNAKTSDDANSPPEDAEEQPTPAESGSLSSDPGQAPEHSSFTTSSYLTSKEYHENFTLRFQCQVEGNAGVIVRGAQSKNKVVGYRISLDAETLGDVSETEGRGLLQEATNRKAIQDRLVDGEWNQIEISVVNEKRMVPDARRRPDTYLRVVVNDVVAVQFTDSGEDRLRSIANPGLLALEISAGSPAKVRFQDLEIKPAAEPSGDQLSFVGAAMCAGIVAFGLYFGMLRFFLELDILELLIFTTVFFLSAVGAEQVSHYLTTLML